MATQRLLFHTLAALMDVILCLSSWCCFFFNNRTTVYFCNVRGDITAVISVYYCWIAYKYIIFSFPSKITVRYVKFAKKSIWWIDNEKTQVYEGCTHSYQGCVSTSSLVPIYHKKWQNHLCCVINIISEVTEGNIYWWNSIRLSVGICHSFPQWYENVGTVNTVFQKFCLHIRKKQITMSWDLITISDHHKNFLNNIMGIHHTLPI